MSTINLYTASRKIESNCSQFNQCHHLNDPQQQVNIIMPMWLGRVCLLPEGQKQHAGIC